MSNTVEQFSDDLAHAIFEVQENTHDGWALEKDELKVVIKDFIRSRINSHNFISFDPDVVVEKLDDWGRCDYYATDPITTRHPRDDGWRCGENKNRIHNHTLYTSDGENILYAGKWVKR